MATQPHPVGSWGAHFTFIGAFFFCIYGRCVGVLYGIWEEGKDEGGNYLYDT
jgi:hypothetical protein